MRNPPLGRVVINQDLTPLRSKKIGEEMTTEIRIDGLLPAEMAWIMAEGIQPIPGVLETLTCLAVED